MTLDIYLENIYIKIVRIKKQVIKIQTISIVGGDSHNKLWKKLLIVYYTFDRGKIQKIIKTTLASSHATCTKSS